MSVGCKSMMIINVLVHNSVSSSFVLSYEKSLPSVFARRRSNSTMNYHNLFYHCLMLFYRRIFLARELNLSHLRFMRCLRIKGVGKEVGKFLKGIPNNYKY